MQGLTFPLSITNGGRFSVTSEEAKILQNVQHIVRTYLQERDYEPTMGTVGYAGILRSSDKTAMSQLGALLEQSINEQEPRAQTKLFYDEKQSNYNAGRHVFAVRFVIKATGSINDGSIVLE